MEADFEELLLLEVVDGPGLGPVLPEAESALNVERSQTFWRKRRDASP
jgi:hypothetical protein